MQEIARGAIMVNWALERMKIPQFQKSEEEVYADLASETFRALDRQDYDKRLAAGPIAKCEDGEAIPKPDSR
jgi:hypothetical protein